VRVSQAWAGSGYGFFALPREGDEVVISYLDGDPDQPLVTGRVHNSERRNPIRTEDAKKPIAVWRSQTLGKDEQGYNEVLMDDSKGEERLNLHAQRDYTRIVEHDSTVYVKHNDFLTVDWNKTDKIKRAYSMSAGSVTIGCGPYDLRAKSVFIDSRTFIIAHAKGNIGIQGKGDIVIDAGGETAVQGAKIIIQNLGNSITIDDSGIKIKCKKLTIESEGVAHVQSNAEVTIKGTTINLN
jgi:type VI secretion system secreted protein VgrG